ncbi:MAG TPA: methyltransferase domain-containing protein [Gemmatimonadota bacterium]
MEAAAAVAPGRALDLACGAGRNALFLAERGWRVEAVDGSAVALGLLSEKVRERGLQTRVRALAADLESRPRGFELPPAAYDLICDFYFLDRALLEDVRAAVRPGGLLVASIHLADPARPREGNADFLLEPGELREIVTVWSWEILHYMEGPTREDGHRHPSAELIARRPCEVSVNYGLTTL